MSSAHIIDARVEGGTSAFVGYLPAGFPTVDISVKAVQALAHAGADIVEIGLPYSDPTMDGPTIQRAAQASLDEGFKVRELFRVVEACAEAGALPLVMTYYNPIFRYGIADFARDLKAAGGAGLITPDLIPEEAGEWMEASDAYGLDRIFLAAQSSSPERLALIAESSRGFVYAASRMGVTGTRESIDDGARSLVERARTAGAQRVCVGIGVSTAPQVREVAEYADGVIVGSALVSTLFEDDANEALARLSGVAEALAKAAHGEE